MSERLERLLREIEAEKAAALSDLGFAFDGPLVIMGDMSPADAIEIRLRRVPGPLRQDAAARLTRSIVHLHWLHGRRIGGGAS